MTAQQQEQIKQLRAHAKFKEALSEIELLESSEKLSPDDRLMLRYFQSTLFLKMGRLKEGLQVNEQLLEDSKKVGDPLKDALEVRDLFLTSLRASECQKNSGIFFRENFEPLKVHQAINAERI